MSLRYKLINLFLVAILILSAATALASDEIMPIDELERGMEGVGRTVVQGTEIEEFDVEILSIVEESGLNHDLILIETSGDLIEDTGGISSGMSGSPIYIDGQIIGAIGYGWQMADHKIGLVTPIESMFEILELDDVIEGEKELDLSTPLEIGDNTYDKLAFSRNSEEKEISEGTLLATPVETPLMVGGLSGRSKDMVGDMFSEHNMELAPFSGGGVSDLDEEIELKPGSAVAAQLVRGDIDVSAVGTMTYRDDDKILAFAHPFLSKGQVDYMLSSAYIHKMITSVRMPFKIGSPAQLEGSITQDRSAGIAGEIGQFPKVVTMEINVIDRNMGREEKFNLEIVQDEDFLNELSMAAALQAIDNTIDRRGRGTSKVNMEIFANNIEDNIISKENYFYSNSDIAAVSLMDYITLMNLITTNPYQDINLANIKLDIEVEESDRIALVEDIKLDKTEVEPGEKVGAEVFLQPYRDEIVSREVEIEIPEDIQPGSFDIVAFSGQEANYDRLYRSQYEEVEEDEKISSMSDLINLFEDQLKNNQLLVEMIPHYGHYENEGYPDDEAVESTDREEVEDIEESEEPEDPEEDPEEDSESQEEKLEEVEAYPSEEIEEPVFFEKVEDTNYVLEGRARQEIMIVNGENEFRNNIQDETEEEKDDEQSDNE